MNSQLMGWDYHHAEGDWMPYQQCRHSH